VDTNSAVGTARLVQTSAAAQPAPKAKVSKRPETVRVLDGYEAPSTRTRLGKRSAESARTFGTEDQARKRSRMAQVQDCK
jgi:hypothetical protein